MDDLPEHDDRRVLPRAVHEGSGGRGAWEPVCVLGGRVGVSSFAFFSSRPRLSRFEPFDLSLESKYLSVSQQLLTNPESRPNTNDFPTRSAKQAKRRQWNEQWGRIDHEANIWWLGSSRKNWESVMGKSVWWWIREPPRLPGVVQTPADLLFHFLLPSSADRKECE